MAPRAFAPHRIAGDERGGASRLPTNMCFWHSYRRRNRLKKISDSQHLVVTPFWQAFEERRTRGKNLSVGTAL